MLYRFDSLVDTDFGIIRHIGKKYRDPSVFKLEVLSLNDSSLIKLLCDRVHENPLSIILKDEYYADADSLYEDIFSSDKKEVLDLSIVKGIGRAMSLAASSAMIQINILISDEQEKSALGKIYKDELTYITFHQTQDKTPFNAYPYSAIFCNSVNQLDKYSGVIGKEIYVEDYKFNIEVRNGQKNIAQSYKKYSGGNSFTIISPYENSILL